MNAEKRREQRSTEPIAPFDLSRLGNEGGNEGWFDDREDGGGTRRVIVCPSLYANKVIGSGKIRAQSDKSMKFKDGYMISFGQPVHEYRGSTVRHLLLRQEDTTNESKLILYGLY
ncbi:small ribosomal subunit protein uS3y-like [Musa acuminata AAA Group]|uniref:small ribosomal subunit protein uS3y-like n=1 Tax=Musa acuminata AAA Group TaxID=214697 RepID=UPI0031E1240F